MQDGIKYINPWYSSNKPGVTNTHKFFEVSQHSIDNGAIHLEYRGVTVVYRWCWEYVYDGVCIGQRQGFTEETAKEIIDDFFDGEKDTAKHWFHSVRMNESYKKGLALKNS
jgi:hypothetical protein